jgi:hypothetical protein
MPRRFRWLASGELLCELPDSMDLEASRRAVAGLLAESEHRVHFTTQEADAPTATTFVQATECGVVRCSRGRLCCEECDAVICCDCDLTSCDCPDSPVTDLSLQCRDCEFVYYWAREPDEAPYRLTWPGRALCIGCDSFRCRCSLDGRRPPTIRKTRRSRVRGLDIDADGLVA